MSFWFVAICIIQLFCKSHGEDQICIVGAGLSGAVLAERFASQNHKKILIIEKRDHIGGNCFDYIDKETGIRVSKYGAHLFHTKYADVWHYIKHFAHWIPYEHKVVAYVDNKYVPVPVNINTVNALFDLNISTQYDMDRWLSAEQLKVQQPLNSEEMALSRVGKRLYEMIFKPYTIKQWAKTPAELGPEVLARIPVRNNYDPRYFNDRYQALPQGGYTSIFQKMFDNPLITVMLKTDFFQIRKVIKCSEIYFTGPIDAYFASKGWPKLEYRSLDFEKRVLKNTEFFQPNSVVNHPSLSENYTRIVEYKHFLHQKSQDTVIFLEHSKDDGEPYYPVPNPKNKALFKKYQKLADEEKGVTFVGRLANYKYFNMDETIKNALDLFRRHTARYTFIRPTKVGGLSTARFFRKNFFKRIDVEKEEYGQVHAQGAQNVKNPIMTVRNPYDRIRSMYVYWKYGSELYPRSKKFTEKNENVSLDDYLNMIETKDSRLHETFTWNVHHLPMTHWLSKKDYAKTIILEYSANLQHQVGNLLNFIGINSNKKLPKKNNNYRKVNFDISPQTQKKIRELFASDFELYAAVKLTPSKFKKVFYATEKESEPCKAGFFENAKQWKSLFPQNKLPIEKKALVSIPIGKSGFNSVSATISRLGNIFFDFLLFAYDDTDWSSCLWFEWPEVTIIREKGAKWTFYFDYLKPGTVENYSHLFLWDDDLMPTETFDSEVLLYIVQSLDLVASQPMIRKNPHTHVIGSSTKELGGSNFFHSLWMVEIMAPIFESQWWSSCIYPRLVRERGSGFGIDTILMQHGSCTQEKYYAIRQPLDHENHRSLMGGPGVLEKSFNEMKGYEDDLRLKPEIRRHFEGYITSNVYLNSNCIVEEVL